MCRTAPSFVFVALQHAGVMKLFVNGRRVGSVGKGFVERNATNTDYEYVMVTKVVTVLVAMVKELVAEATVVSMIMVFGALGDRGAGGGSGAGNGVDCVGDVCGVS